MNRTIRSFCSKKESSVHLLFLSLVVFLSILSCSAFSSTHYNHIKTTNNFQSNGAPSIRRRTSAFSVHSSSSSSSSSISSTHFAKYLPKRKEMLLFSTTEDEQQTVTSSSSINGSGSINKKEDEMRPTNGDLTTEIMTSSIQQEEEEDDESESSLLTTLQNKLFLGIQPTPEIIAIMTIYFVEGALGLSRLAQTFLLKDELKLGPAELSALTGIFTLPWTIKPIYGFISDGLPLWGYRRRSYLILMGLIGSASYAFLGFPDFFSGIFSGAAGVTDTAVATTVQDAAAVAAGTIASTGDTITAAASTTSPSTALQLTIVSLLIGSACIAFSDVVADGIVVQRTRDSNDPKIAGGLQSLCWGSAALGGLISAYYSGSLLEVMSPRDVFAYTSILPLLVASIALLIDETPVNASPASSSALSKEENLSLAEAEEEKKDASPIEGVKNQITSLYQALKQEQVWKPTLFLFLWQSTPTSEGAFLYFMTNDLGMGPEFLGRVRLVTAAASLIGVWVYQKFLRGVPIKDILFWTSIASTPLGLSQLLLITHTNRMLGIPDGAFVFGDDVALAILGELAFLPTLVLAARLCPPGVEAVLFATLMSVFNGAGTVGTEVGAFLTKYMGVTESNFDNLGLLTIICNVSSLYPLLFIGWLDGVGSTGEDEDDVDVGLLEEHHLVLDVPKSLDKEKSEF